MINSRLTKTSEQQSNEEKLFKLLESMDWKLWEMMNMMKAYMSSQELESKSDTKPKSKTPSKKSTENT